MSDDDPRPTPRQLRERYRLAGLTMIAVGLAIYLLTTMAAALGDIEPWLRGAASIACVTLIIVGVVAKIVSRLPDLMGHARMAVAVAQSSAGLDERVASQQQPRRQRPRRKQYQGEQVIRQAEVEPPAQNVVQMPNPKIYQLGIQEGERRARDGRQGQGEPADS